MLQELTKLGPSSETLLEARNVVRVFGATKALSDANLTLRTHEICGLIGANGAGKSTLSRIISGHTAPTSGELIFRGAPFSINSTRDALRSGIALVAQETSLAPDMSVLENIFLPNLGMPGRLSYSQLRRRALEILAELGHEHALPLDEEIQKLSSAQRQLIEIAKALALNADLVIFDEPTASLSPSEVDRLFDIMAKLRDDGKALVFVSHRLEEVSAITDSVTILREGKTVAKDLVTSSLSQLDIIRHMVGREIGNVYRSTERIDGAAERPMALEVTGLVAEPHVRDVSFSVRKGEILGLGGLVGAGRSQSAEAIFGLRRRTGGTIKLNGKIINPRSPAAAIRAGIGMVAEDRHVQNIVPDLNVGENLFLAQMGQHKGLLRGFKAGQAKAEKLLQRLGLPADRLGASLLQFSGGMQQKVIIARWLMIEPEVLILDEPTKGVDIGTRQTIYELLREVAARGVPIVVISSDFEELLGLCERIVVMSDGYTVADIPADLLSEESLALLAAPRTSAEKNIAFLNGLVEKHGGVAFWGLIENDTLICLAAAEATGRPGLGLQSGHIYNAGQTQIVWARAGQAGEYITDPKSGWATLLNPLSHRRGHNLGWIGLSLPAGADRPDAKSISAQIASLTETDATEENPS